MFSTVNRKVVFITSDESVKDNELSKDVFAKGMNVLGNKWLFSAIIIIHDDIIPLDAVIVSLVVLHLHNLVILFGRKAYKHLVHVIALIVNDVHLGINSVHPVVIRVWQGMNSCNCRTSPSVTVMIIRSSFNSVVRHASCIRQDRDCCPNCTPCIFMTVSSVNSTSNMKIISNSTKSTASSSSNSMPGNLVLVVNNLSQSRRERSAVREGNKSLWIV